MKRLLFILLIAAGLTISGCGSDDAGHSHGEDTHTHNEQATQHSSDEGHEHPHDSTATTGPAHTHADSEGGHSHAGEDAHSHEGEDSGAMLELNETYDEVRKGVRLTLSYDSDTKSFSGTVENTTRETLPQVSVGVELSNGAELGPTTPVDLEAGESQPVELDAAGETFERWSAHSKMGSGGHSHGEDADHEH